MIRWAIHRFDSQQSTVTEAKDSTARTRRITANRRLIVTRGQTCDLQFQCALAAPEPRDRRVWQPFARYSRSDAPCLISGILHSLQSHEPIRRIRIAMTGTI